MTSFQATDEAPVDGPSTVLLVDDSKPHRTLVRRSLESAPELRIIAEAANGTDAIALASAWKPDIILLDLRKAAKAGLLEALTKIVLASPLSSVIMLTDPDQSQVESRALARGAVGVLPSDVDPSHIPAAIAEILHGAGPPVTVLSPRILVVGYDPETRRAVSDGLAQALHAAVVGVARGSDALEKLPDEHFDLIVCANKIDDMLSPSFLAQSAALAPGTPTIMFARLQNPSTEAEAREAGAALVVPRAAGAPGESIQNLARRLRRLLFALTLSRQ
ncbi:MAG TPA: response regulator [Candidatus Thermoplasmatota archaeon]